MLVIGSTMKEKKEAMDFALLRRRLNSLEHEMNKA